MKYELWNAASASSYMLLFEGDTASDHVKEPDAKVIWTVEAETYEEALQKRNDFLGWGEFKKQTYFDEERTGARTFSQSSGPRPRAAPHTATTRTRSSPSYTT